MLKHLLIISILAIMFAGFTQTARADGYIGITIGESGRYGHWETHYRYEQYYVPGSLIGYTVEGAPIYSQGYYAQRAIPYNVWVERPAPIYRRPHYAPRYRHRSRPNIDIGLGFFFGR